MPAVSTWLPHNHRNQHTQTANRSLTNHGEEVHNSLRQVKRNSGHLHTEHGPEIKQSQCQLKNNTGHLFEINHEQKNFNHNQSQIQVKSNTKVKSNTRQLLPNHGQEVKRGRQCKEKSEFTRWRKKTKWRLSSRVLIPLMILNVTGHSEAVESLTSRMLATLLGYPLSCSVGGEARECSLALTCWLRGGARARGCGGGWLLACCVARKQEDSQSAVSVSSEWRYKAPPRLRSVPQRDLPPNVFRRRADDDTSQVDCGLPASRMLQKRIIGGREARFAEFPWQAHVRISEFQCGGVLVSHWFVATAAHCVSRARPRDIAVWLGAHDTSAGADTALKVGVIQKILHPLFQFRVTQPDRYDVALLKLARPVPYAGHILPICLPDAGLELRGKSGVIAGWGKTDASGGHTGTNLLRSATVPILSKFKCRVTQPDRLLQLARPVPYAGHILPICLPDAGLELRGRSGVIAGWGKTDASGGHTGTNLLRSATVPILSKSKVRVTQPDRLLQLARPVPYAGHILPICLPDAGLELRGRSGVIAGWGKTDASGGHTGTNLLRSATVPILSKSKVRVTQPDRLLQLARPVPYAGHILPICLPDAGLELRGKSGVIAGWGKTDASGGHTGTNLLRSATVPILSKFKFRVTQPDRLLQLARPVPYAGHILPICLPDAGLELRGRSGVIAGWGKTDASGGHTGTNLLRSATVPILSTEQCIKWHQSKQISVEIHSEMLCAGHPDGHQDACLGDSGGPLIVLDGGRFYLAGITSAGFGCGVDHQPGIYHNAQLTAPWMRQVLSPVNNYIDF